MKKWMLAVGIPLVLIGVLALGTYMWIRSPVDTESYTDPGSADATEQNTALTAALLAGGLEDAFVDVTSDQAYVAYEPPHDSETSATDWQWFVLGAAADTVSDADLLVVVQYEAGHAASSWSVPMDALQSFASGGMGVSSFESTIDKRTY